MQKCTQTNAKSTKILLTKETEEPRSLESIRFCSDNKCKFLLPVSIHFYSIIGRIYLSIDAIFLCSHFPSLLFFHKLWVVSYFSFSWFNLSLRVKDFKCSSSFWKTKFKLFVFIGRNRYQAPLMLRIVLPSRFSLFIVRLRG